MSEPKFTQAAVRLFDQWWADPSSTAQSLPNACKANDCIVAFQAGYDASSAPDLLAACNVALADAEKAVNPSARLPNYEDMKAAVAKAEGR
jgi:hypothetical protein